MDSVEPVSAGGEEHRKRDYPKDKYVYIIPGLGTKSFSLVENVLFNTADEAVLIIIERDLAWIKHMLSVRDWTDYFKKNRLVIIHSDDRQIIHKNMEVVMDRMSRSVHLFEGDGQGDWDWIAGVLETCVNYSDVQRTALLTEINNSRITCGNLVKNAYHYIDNPGLNDLKNTCKGVPALVVSAGPSLDKQMGELRFMLEQVDRHCVIISCLTMYKPLKSLGVDPHFVTGLDYHEVSARFLEDVDDVQRYRSRRDTIFVLEPKVSDAVVDALPDNAPIRFCANAWLDRLLGLPANRIDSIGCGSTVAHLSFYLAEYLGCSEIYLVGQDLSFTAKKYYPDIIYENHCWKGKTTPVLTDINKYGVYETTDINGDTVYYDNQMQCYHEQFKSIIKACEVPVINCTEGGIIKEDVRIMTLADAMNGLKRVFQWERPSIAQSNKANIYKQDLNYDLRCALNCLDGIVAKHKVAIGIYNNFIERNYSEDFIKEWGLTMKCIGEEIAENRMTELVEEYSGLAKRMTLWDLSDMAMQTTEKLSEKQEREKRTKLDMEKMKHLNENIEELKTLIEREIGRNAEKSRSGSGDRPEP